MSRTTSSDRPRRAVGAGGVGVGPAELVAAEALELGVVASMCGASCGAAFSAEVGGAGRGSSGRRRVGTCVVQTCVAVGDGGQPLDVDAEQPARTPRSRPRTAAGTRAATCCTGQWCWQSCTPAQRCRRAGRARGGVAVGGQRRGERLGARPRVVAGRVDDAGGSAPRARRPAARANARDRVLAGRGRRRKRSARGGEVVVAGSNAARPASVSDEQPGRAAAAARAAVRAARAPRPARRRPARRGGGGRRPGSGRAARRGGGGDRTVLRARPRDPVAGARVAGASRTPRGRRRAAADFHNTIVT